MYIPSQFEITDRNEMLAYIRANGFGQLVSCVDGRPLVTHMPFLLSDDNCSLVGHMARNNPQWQTIENQEVLVTLQGPHDYISPSWYSTASVPTWDYQAAHVYGICTVFEQPQRLQEVVDELSNQYEETFEQPWQPEYRKTMLQAIVGIDIQITNIQCKYKLSQNRPKQDQLEIIRQLKSRGSVQLAQAIERSVHTLNE